MTGLIAFLLTVPLLAVVLLALCLTISKEIEK